MTKSKNGQKIIDRIPINRLLIESDGPFTSLGSKKFTPLMVDSILDGICHSKNDINPKEINQIFVIKITSKLPARDKIIDIKVDFLRPK